jgi:uncharacterized protein (DUF362 family)
MVPEKITRRTFIKQGTVFLLGGTVGVISGQNLLAPEKPRLPDLVIVKGKEPGKMVNQGVEALGGWEKYVKNLKVLIKPNMSFAAPPARGSNTSPGVVKAVAEACLAAGAKKVVIADHTLHRPERCLKESGIAEACKELKEVKVLSLNKKGMYRKVTISKAKQLKKVDLAKIVSDSDIVINLPTAKSHSATGVTLGLKNLMGLVWDRGYFHWRISLHQGIADLFALLKPQVQLTILDATRALVTGGPKGPGLIEHPQKLVIGRDTVAVDTYGVGLANWDERNYTPQNILHIVAAAKMNLGETELSKLKVKEIEVKDDL